jgi:hypothetical protein
MSGWIRILKVGLTFGPPAGATHVVKVCEVVDVRISTANP